MSSYNGDKILSKVTVPYLQFKKSKGLKISMLTAYDYSTAKILDAVGIDALLIGDSLGTVLYGEPNTLSVTMEDMIRHTRAVAKGAERALIVADMPFLSYQTSRMVAVKNAGRLVAEAGANAIKLEGGAEFASTIKAIVKAGIPVMGHIGLMPQSINTIGKYRSFGKDGQERKSLLQAAKSLERAGCFAIVLECVDTTLAHEISQSISIPTIGIGSGEECDGQILVTHDLVGLTSGKVPRFVSPLANLREPFEKAIRQYIARTEGIQTISPEKKLDASRH